MNILVSICGFGNGHSMRQSHIIQALLQRGHRIALFGFLNSQRYFSEHFPQLPLYPLKVPTIHVSSKTGLDFGRIADEPANFFDDGTSINFRAMQDAYNYFGGAPDLIISDYELVAAQLAYATNTPFVTLDQHSKFAGFQFPPANGYTRLEERSRLGMFFPAADLRLACSFFELSYPPDPSFPVTIIPPILRESLLALDPNIQATSNEIVVYLSAPYGKKQQAPTELYRLLADFPEKTFAIYGAGQTGQADNLNFCAYSPDGFLQSLSRAAAVITTAGHNLLSELAYLKKPVYALPLPFFEQQACAAVIQNNELGIGSEEITPATLRQFFDTLPHYQQQLNIGRGLIGRYDGLELAMNLLHQHFGV